MLARGVGARGTFVLVRGGGVLGIAVLVRRGRCLRDICVSPGRGGGVSEEYLNICVSPGVYEGYLC